MHKYKHDKNYPCQPIEILIGEVLSPNLGDAVICHTALTLFQKYHSDTSSILYDVSIARHPPRRWSKWVVNRLYSNPRINHRYFDHYLYLFSLYYYLRKIPHNAKIIFVGGALLQDYFSDAIAAILKVAERKKCKVVFQSLGIGPLSSNNIKRLSKLICNNSHIRISLRDGIPFFKTNISDNITFTPDIAILANTIYPFQGKPEYIGIGTISIPQYNSIHEEKVEEEWYILQCVAIAKEILVHGEKVAIFSNGDYGDYEISKKIFNRISGHQNVILLPRPQTDKQLVGFFQCFKCTITSRLHSIILSYSFNIPFIAISWDPKVDAFAKTINLSERVYKMIDINTVSWETIADTIAFPKFDKEIRSNLTSVLLNSLSVTFRDNNLQ